MKKGYDIKAQEDNAEIMIYEPIGQGLFGGLSAKQFVQDLKKLDGVKNITVRLNSPGGEVFEGAAIYNALVNHPANIEVAIDGMALSMASVIAMAGDKVTMAENAMMMVHEPTVSTSGNASALRKSAEILDKTTQSILNAYAKKTKKEHEELNALMVVETWMSAAEALDFGFIDAISEPIEMAALFDLKAYGYKQIPVAFVQPTENVSVEAAIDQERVRVKAIIEIGKVLNQPQMAKSFMSQDISVDEARKQMFDQFANQQDSETITSFVAPLSTSANPLIDDAKERSSNQ